VVPPPYPPYPWPLPLNAIETFPKAEMKALTPVLLDLSPPPFSGTRGFCFNSHPRSCFFPPRARTSVPLPCSVAQKAHALDFNHPVAAEGPPVDPMVIVHMARRPTAVFPLETRRGAPELEHLNLCRKINPGSVFSLPMCHPAPPAPRPPSSMPGACRERQTSPVAPGPGSLVPPKPLKSPSLFVGFSFIWAAHQVFFRCARPGRGPAKTLPRAPLATVRGVPRPSTVEA